MPNEATNPAMFADPSTDFKAQSDKLARRRQLAEQLVAASMAPGAGAPGAGMHGKIYMVGAGPLSQIAQAVGGQYVGNDVDQQQAQLNAQQQQAQDQFTQEFNAAPDEQTRQQLLATARNRGLRYDLEQQFAKADADRIERGEQLAADRVAKSEEAEANRIERGEQQAADRVARQDLRAMPTIHISTSGARGDGGAGQGKAPSGYRWNGDNLEAIPGGPHDASNAKPAKLTAAQQKAYDDSDVLLGHIDNALDAIKTSPNAIGFKTIMPDMALSKIDPEGVAARAAVAGLSAERVHQLSGAAVSPAEFARLRPYLPASGDTAEAARKKLTSLRGEVERIKAAHARGPTMATPPKAPPAAAAGAWDAGKEQRYQEWKARNGK